MFTNPCPNSCFFALYKVLFVTIEMRQMPFFGWIQDLSERTQQVYFIYLVYCHMMFPLLVIGAWAVAMGVSMWIQQKLNPAPTDPIS